MPKIRWTVGLSLEDEFDALCKYAIIVENSLAQAIEQNNAEIEALMSEIPDEDRHHYDEDIAHSQWLFSEAFLQIFRHSLYVTCFSLFESCLAQECNYYPKPEKGPSKPKRTYIRSCMEFLKKETMAILEEEGQKPGKGFVDQTSEWMHILIYDKIRNCIVHCNGRASDGFLNKNKEVRPFIDERSSVIILSEHNYIHLQKGFHLEFISTVKRFFSKLHGMYSP